MKSIWKAIERYLRGEEGDLIIQFLMILLVTFALIVIVLEVKDSLVAKSENVKDIIDGIQIPGVGGGGTPATNSVVP